MRIIAGAYKGRTLKTPTWDGLRPTSDKLRETLFNILAPRIEGARVLDLFAGTGAVALEALSRGAAAATCVERDPRAIKLIEANVARCGANGCAIIRGDVQRALQRPLPGRPFDIVVLDPPYDYAELESVIAGALTQRGEGGVVILEHAARVAPPAPGGFAPARTVRSGDSALTFY